MLSFSQASDMQYELVLSFLHASDMQYEIVLSLSLASDKIVLSFSLASEIQFETVSSSLSLKPAKKIVNVVGYQICDCLSENQPSLDHN